MTAGHRLAAPHGLLIDRDRPISFRFEGRRYTGFVGDTLASALTAAGRDVLSRSFKYHRPRGVLTAAGLDANTLVQLAGRPNVNADLMPITQGLEAWGQNYRGSLDADADIWLGWAARFLPVGFYYRAFFRKPGGWRFWEPVFRSRAGLGRVDEGFRHPRHDKAYGHYDVVVIGAGPAGLAAARAAAEAGARVTVIEGDRLAGGRWLLDGQADRAGAMADALGAMPGGDLRLGQTCTGLFQDGLVAVADGTRLHKLRARAIIVATGRLDQPAVFRNNDLPGVMMASAALRLAHLYGVAPGRRVVVLAGHDGGAHTALALKAMGVRVTDLVDLRLGEGDAAALARLRAAGITAHLGFGPRRALAGLGQRRITGLEIAAVNPDAWGSVAYKTTRLECDTVLMDVGAMPHAHLLCHRGVRLAYDPARADYVLGDLPADVFAAGGVAGFTDADSAQSSGRHAGALAAAHAGFPVDPGPGPDLPPATNHPYPIFPHADGKDFLDFDEDLQTKDIIQTIAHGYDHIELVKRFSTLGMGPSQGKQSAINGTRLVADLTGRPPETVGATTWRPPAEPETMALLAGRGFEPVRHMPAHHRHLEAEARMMPAGAWLRPAVYGPAGDRDRLTAEEVLAVRQGVGLIDVSSLGGIDLRGPDAAALLERAYTSTFTAQRVGTARYALLCDQTGAVSDDGVACRLAEDHFYLTTTSTGSDAVYRTLLFWQAQWRLDVDLTNVTAAFGAFSLAGPLARKVLGELCSDTDLSAAAFPPNAVRLGTVAGVPCRLVRTAFVGELGYELHAPTPMAEALWDAVMRAGIAEGIRPVGVEAQRVLRLEKGHIIIGQDTDGLTLPQEAGLAWAIARKTPGFLGSAAIRFRTERPLGRRLVGFALPAGEPLPRESDLVVRDGSIAGRVTSVAVSPSPGPYQGRGIGLAYVHPSDGDPGARIVIKTDSRLGGGGRFLTATVVKPPFYDPEGARL